MHYFHGSGHQEAWNLFTFDIIVSNTGWHDAYQSVIVIWVCKLPGILSS